MNGLIRRFGRVLGFLLAVLIGTVASGQMPPGWQNGAQGAYLLTIGPGHAVYELFGHNAIVLSGVDDAGRPWEVAYNWGVFDFNQPNFVGRFIQGRMLYTMQGQSVSGTISLAEEQGRWVRVRRLGLSTGQVRRLAELIARNDTDGNRDYRYDYYRDNCSTRVRDMIDRATEGQVASALQSTTAGRDVTYRFHTDRLSKEVLWLWLGLKYVLGHPVDVELNRWEESFLPMQLERHLASLTIKHEDGIQQSLLGAEVYVSKSGVQPSASAPPDWGVWTGLGGLLFATLVIGLCWAGKSWTPRLAGLLIAAWAGLCCVAGGISTWGWWFTDHAVAKNNENWLQLNPLSLPILLAGLLLTFGFKPKWAFWSATGVLSLSLFGWILKLIPGMIQPNWPILLLALPIHFGVTAGLWKLTRSSS